MRLLWAIRERHRLGIGMIERSSGPPRIEVQNRYTKVTWGNFAYLLFSEFWVLASVTENRTISAPTVLLMDVGCDTGVAATLVAFTALQQSDAAIR